MGGWLVRDFHTELFEREERLLKIKALIAAFCLTTLVACGATHAVLPSASQGSGNTMLQHDSNATGDMRTPTSKDKFVSEGGTLRSFSQAQHLTLTSDADFGGFVDASIVGAARSHAIKLLELMPPAMRGDFVEIHPDGSVTSNRTDLPPLVKFRPALSARSRVATSAASERSPMSYPPTGGSGGPYIRLYSYQNINAAYGVATPPCDIALNRQNHDSGNMYFNAYDSNGSDLTDAGIGADEYPDRAGASDVFAWVNSPQTGGWDPGQVSGSFVNAYEWWSCGQPLAMMYGTLPYPQYQVAYNGQWYGESMLAVGPPDYDPSQFKLPPATVTLQNPAWTFFYTPPGLDSQPSTYDGIASNCQYCSTAVMYTIAEHFADGSCYGMCKLSNGWSAADGKWSNVVMGELVSPCGPSQFGIGSPCTLEYASSGSWYSGEDDCGMSCATSWGSSDGTNQDILEGIADLSYPAPQMQSRITVAASSLPTAPPSACTPDAAGYCDEIKSTTLSGVCDDGTRYINGREMEYYIHAFNRTYYIFKKQTMLELQETATENETIPDSAPCTPTYSWSPNDPKVYYNDSNLP